MAEIPAPMVEVQEIVDSSGPVVALSMAPQTPVPATPDKLLDTPRSRRRQCYTLNERNQVCAHLLARDRFVTLDRISRKEKDSLCSASGMDGKRLLKMLDNARNHPVGPEQERIIQARLVKWHRQMTTENPSAVIEPSSTDIDFLSKELTRRFLEGNDPLIIQRRVVSERLAFNPHAQGHQTIYRLRHAKKLNSELFPFFQYMYVKAGLSTTDIPEGKPEEEDVKKEDAEMLDESGNPQPKQLEDVAAAEVIMQLAKMSRSPRAPTARPGGDVPPIDDGIPVLDAGTLAVNAINAALAGGPALDLLTGSQEQALAPAPSTPQQQPLAAPTNMDISNAV